MNHTTNYQLSQWSADDRVQRGDFNADNAKIDAALKAEADARTTAVSTINTTLAQKVGIIAGTYIGDGAEVRFINLGVTPKAVLLFRFDGCTYLSNACVGGLALPGHPAGCPRDVDAVARIVTNGFNVCSTNKNGEVGMWSNLSNYKYHYLAFV